jgi:cell wall-associated NlpC family hydrolase
MSGHHVRKKIHVKADRSKIIRTADSCLGIPYKYGGEDRRGFDCSGFVMYVYRRNGIDMPRSIRDQFYSGARISIKYAKPGDLVFFRTRSAKTYSHVGIYMGDNRFIHSPRTGRKISYAYLKQNYWKKRYLGAISVIDDNKKKAIKKYKMDVSL